MITELLKYIIAYCKIKANHIKSGGAKSYIGLDVKFVNHGSITIGNNVIIRPSSCVYANKANSIVKFGNGSEIGNHSTISSVNKVIIEDNVLTGPHVFISDHNHEYRNPQMPICKQDVMLHEESRVVIGEGSWLGTNVVVVGNVRVGKHCVIGANSVVTKDIPDYTVAAGIPCKVIKRYDFEKEEWVRV